MDNTRINNKVEFDKWIRYEHEKYMMPGGLKDLLLYLSGSERAVIWSYQKRLRKTEFYNNTSKKIKKTISLILLNYKSNRYGIHIGLNVCGKGLKIMHLGSILMNGNVRIGEDVSIHINTAFVAKGTSHEAPIIGNGCVIGVGAVVMGGISIANNVAIGANSVVCKDVLEENIAIAGVPAKKVSNNGRLQWN